MGQIVLDRVTKAYTGDVRGIDELSLDVADGEFMVLVGPSGCGKSTALRSVAGLEEITSGTISAAMSNRSFPCLVSCTTGERKAALWKLGD